MRKHRLTAILAAALVMVAAFALVGMASAAERSARPQAPFSAAALQARATPTATASRTVGSARPTATPTRKPAAKRKPTATAIIPAPKLQDYQDATFSWKWDGVKQAGKQDWYFDIQLYQGTAQDPYHIVLAEQAETRLDKGIWYYKAAANAECNSFWVVQIAKRLNGKFVGWISPKSDRLPIGGSCRSGSGPAGPTPCPNCGGGGG